MVLLSSKSKNRNSRTANSRSCCNAKVIIKQKSLKDKMKKVLKCMGMMALVALAFTSCKKNDDTKRSFYASGDVLRVENVNLSEDRAYCDDNFKFHFELGDVCMVFNIDETTPTNSHAALYGAVEDGVTEVHFVNINYGEVAEDMLDGYYAFYPGGPGHTVTYLANGENKCKFYVDPVQEHRENMVPKNCFYAAAKASDGSHMMGDTYFLFKPINGVLQLKLRDENERTITKVEIVDNAWELSGLVELIIPEVDPAEMQALFDNFDLDNPAYVNRLNEYKARVGYNVTDETIYDPVFETTTHYVKGNRMTYNIPGGVKLEPNYNDTPALNIVLRPLALSRGFHIYLTFDDNTTVDYNLSNYYGLMIKPGAVHHVSGNITNL